MSMIRYSTCDSTVGRLLFVGDGEVLTRLHMEDPSKPPQVQEDWKHDSGAFRSAREQMAAYFAGDLTQFDLRLDASGTPFQKRVWNALVEIPYGKTASYGEVARNVDMPTASRAVGSANSRNPIAIVVPCHRVIGASGKLTGYAGGLERKKQLLALEADVTARISAHREVDLRLAEEIG